MVHRIGSAALAIVVFVLCLCKVDAQGEGNTANQMLVENTTTKVKPISTERNHSTTTPSLRNEGEENMANQMLVDITTTKVKPIFTGRNHSTTTPSLRNPKMLECLENLNRRVTEARNNIDIAFIGETLTQQWETVGNKTWDKYYKSRKAIPLACSGDRTENVLYRLDNGNADGITPKVTVLKIGTDNTEFNTAEEIVKGIKAVIAKLFEKWPNTRILLLAIFPRGMPGDEVRHKISEVNNAIEKLENGNNIRFIDINHKFMKKDGTIPETLMPDLLHLSPEGYKIWAKSINPTLKTLLEYSPE